MHNKKSKSSRHILFGLGILSIALGIYQIKIGKEFSDYFFNLFIGLTLIGTVYFDKEDPTN